MHAMIDLETLGLSSGKAILQIGAVPFCVDKLFVDRPNTLSIECTLSEKNKDFDKSTLSWWLRQPNSSKMADCIDNGIEIEDALLILTDWVKINEITHVWAKPSSLDISMIESVYSKCGMKVPWHYRNIRDCRTLFDLWTRLTGEREGSEPWINWQGLGLEPHIAWCDAVGQAHQTVLAFSEINIVCNSFESMKELN